MICSMPAEWETHLRTWMAWPHRDGLYEWDLPKAQEGYAAVARAISAFEPVTMVVDPSALDGARALLGPEISLLALPLDDAWMRDIGPTFLRNDRGEKLLVDWRFNAWGGKHEPYDQDARLVERLGVELGLDVRQSALFFEGGGLHSDGEGTILTTESVLLNPNRNPGWSKQEAINELKRALGAEEVIVLPGDWEEYETDGHVDGLAAFISPGKVILEVSEDPSDPRYETLAENRRALELARDAKGRSFEILEVPEALEAAEDSDIFCISYVNFYLCNGGVIYPTYGIESDETFRQQLARAFPDRKLAPLDVREIAKGGGGIHCITQQEPL